MKPVGMREVKQADRILWIDVHYASFGVISSNGVIKHAAPIASWMVGRTLADVKPYLLGEKAIVKELFV